MPQNWAMGQILLLPLRRKAFIGNGKCILSFGWKAVGPLDDLSLTERIEEVFGPTDK